MMMQDKSIKSLGNEFFGLVTREKSLSRVLYPAKGVEFITTSTNVSAVSLPSTSFFYP